MRRRSTPRPNTASSTATSSRAPTSSASRNAPPPKSARVTATTAVGRWELAHGVPVWADWYRSVGTHGRKRTPPAAMATNAGTSPSRPPSGPRRLLHHDHASISSTAASSHMDQ